VASGEDAGADAASASDASGDVSTTPDAISLSDAHGDAQPELDAGGDGATGDDASQDAGANATVIGSAGGQTLTAREARALRTTSAPLEQLTVTIADQAMSCGQLNAGTLANANLVVLSIAAQSKDAGAIAPGTYPLSGSSPAANFAFYSTSSKCKASQLVYADGANGGTGSITLDQVDTDVRGSFTVTMNTGGGTMTGTFDAPLCDPVDVDGGACQ
jgi:hypothetical protein